MLPKTIQLSRAWDWGGLTLRQLAERSFEQIIRHETMDRAAIVAFYALLSLAPFLSLLIAATLGGGGSMADELLNTSKQLLPLEADTLIRDELRKIQSSAPVGVLSLSFLLLLWSSSSSFVAVMDSINAAYESRDERPWWRRRLMAIVLTAVESAFLIAALVAILAWPHIVRLVGLEKDPSVLTTLFQWATVMVLLLLSFSLAYNFGTDVKHSWEWITPGGLWGVLGLIAATQCFRLYLAYGFSLSETYGALTGVVVLLLWFYITALSLLVGAEMNSVIDHARRNSPQTGHVTNDVDGDLLAEKG